MNEGRRKEVLEEVMKEVRALQTPYYFQTVGYFLYAVFKYYM